MSEAIAPILEAILRKADQKLEAARRSLDARDWDDAPSRAYYAAFHAVTAVLRQRGAVFTSQEQTLGAFNRDFVATGQFPKDTARVLTRLFKDRQLGDYEVLATLDAETAREDVHDAGQLVRLCRDLVGRGG
ncbi:MAG: hypothetical protein RL653_2210 [Pseudomonadota bacterium]